MVRTRQQERGLRRSGPGFVARVRAYFRQHAHHSLGALARLARQPVASLLTVAVIGIALALPAGLNVLIANARVLSAGWESAVDFSVYLNHGVALERAEALAVQTRAREGITAVEIISAEAALVEFREHSGFTAALESLGENPLPHTLVVRPAPSLGPRPWQQSPPSSARSRKSSWCSSIPPGWSVSWASSTSPAGPRKSRCSCWGWR